MICVQNNGDSYFFGFQTFFMVWECDSPAMPAIYDNFLFCQVSSTGFPVHSDLFVELQIERTRYDCGKLDYCGLDADLEASFVQECSTLLTPRRLPDAFVF
jgi:hypothetical protein